MQIWSVTHITDLRLQPPRKLSCYGVTPTPTPDHIVAAALKVLQEVGDALSSPVSSHLTLQAKGPQSAHVRFEPAWTCARMSCVEGSSLPPTASGLGGMPQAATSAGLATRTSHIQRIPPPVPHGCGSVGAPEKRGHTAGWAVSLLVLASDSAVCSPRKLGTKQGGRGGISYSVAGKLDCGALERGGAAHSLQLGLGKP